MTELEMLNQQLENAKTPEERAAILAWIELEEKHREREFNDSWKGVKQRALDAEAEDLW